ncbi:MAG: phage head closure protein, partial [Pseudonocardiaceae bacterium]
MRAGTLCHLVTIQTPSPVGRSSYGDEVMVWVDIAQRSAAIEPLQGRELWAAQQIVAQISHRIRMRYQPDV